MNIIDNPLQSIGEIHRLKLLCAQAADALEEDQPLIGEPVPTREVNRVLQEREALIAELRKAAE